MKSLIAFIVSACVFALPLEAVLPGAFVGKTVMTPSSTANLLADFWLKYEFNAAAGAMTNTQLGTDTGKSAASFTPVDTGFLMSTGTAAQMTMLSTVNSTTDTGTRGVIYDCSVGTVAHIDYTLTPVAEFTIGMWVKTSQPAAFDFGPRFLVLFSAGGGDDVYLSDQNNGGDGVREFLVRSNGVSTRLASGSIANNTIYWVAVHYVKNGTSDATVRSVTGTIVGTTVTWTAPNDSIDTMKFVSNIAMTAQASEKFYMDNIIYTLTTGVSSASYGP